MGDDREATEASGKSLTNASITNWPVLQVWSTTFAASWITGSSDLSVVGHRR